MPTTKILVPIYQSKLSPLDEFSLKYSLRVLSGRHVCFIAPKSLDYTYYQLEFPSEEIHLFDDHYFSSISAYNKLMLHRGFYETYAASDFIMIMQTDAIILHDRLGFWEETAYDYIGAPWPQGMTRSINVDKFSREGLAKTVRSVVGNGGLSLRRTRRCLELLDEFPQAIQLYLNNEFNEDGFFSTLGQLSNNFIIPNELTAATFSLELAPDYYYNITGQEPMGVHAWWKYNPEFWLLRFESVPPISDLINYLIQENRIEEALRLQAS
jgi:hypothetical protein